MPELTAAQAAMLAARYAAADSRNGGQQSTDSLPRDGVRADTAASPADGPLSPPAAPTLLPGQQHYALPDGFTVAGWEADGLGWNGYPVPVLTADAYAVLVARLSFGPDDTYSAAYSDDRHAAVGYYCDGLQWEYVEDES